MKDVRKSRFGIHTPSFQDFDESKAARQYAVKIKCERAYNGQSGQFVNRDTSEVLIISHPVTGRCVDVERKPVDKK